MKRWLLLAAIVIAGCHKDEGPGCDKIADHMLDVTKQMLPGHDAQTLGTNKEALRAQCEKRNYSPEMRKCLMAAKTLNDLGECQAKGKPANPVVPAPTPAPAIPVPSTTPTAPSTTPVAPSPTPLPPTAGSGG